MKVNLIILNDSEILFEKNEKKLVVFFVIYFLFVFCFYNFFFTCMFQMHFVFWTKNLDVLRTIWGIVFNCPRSQNRNHILCELELNLMKNLKIFFYFIIPILSLTICKNKNRFRLGHAKSDKKFSKK